MENWGTEDYCVTMGSLGMITGVNHAHDSGYCLTDECIVSSLIIPDCLSLCLAAILHLTLFADGPQINSNNTYMTKLDALQVVLL